MKKFLLGIFILGMFSGIIPAVVINLMEHSNILTIIVGIIAIVWTAYELCKE